ncbi:MAG: CPBP family intramembrane metalloprotease [Bacteroidaceae bacterium]|nr:CPBP family intramembrane metalloprotease [Bacteroidaceae bacterium]
MNWRKITPALLSLMVFLLAQALIPAVAFGIGTFVSPDFGTALQKFLNGETTDLPLFELMPIPMFSLTIMATNIIAILICYRPLRYIRPIKASDFGTIRWQTGLLAIAGGILGGFSLSIMTENIALPDSMMQMSMAMSKSIWGLLALAIVGPITEELLFREAIEGEMLRRKASPWTAIIVSALAFSIVHLNLAQGLYALPLGIMFGIIRYKTGNIILPSLLHILNNSIVALQLCTLGEEMADLSYAEMFGGNTAAQIAMLLSGMLSILLITLFWNHTTPKAE